MINGKKEIKIVSLLKNKKALFDYEIVCSYEASIELYGYEVKSVKEKLINLKGSFIIIRDGILYIQKFHISPYKNVVNKTAVDPLRERKLFLKKKDIFYLSQKLKEKGFSLIPEEVYLKGNLIKVKVSLVKGKKKFEKKQILKERSIDKQAKIESSRLFR